NVRLSTGAKLSEFLADLSIMDEEPPYADGRPLEHGIGLLVFKHDRPEVAAYTQGWFPLRGKNYDAVWDQVHHGRYAACNIDIWCRSSRNHHGSIGSVCTHTTITRANPTTSSKGTIQPSLPCPPCIRQRLLPVTADEELNEYQQPLQFQTARQCGARTKSGKPCRSPATKKGRCRLHGGASGSGGPPGERNGQYRHGEPTKAALTEQPKVGPMPKN